MKLKHYYLAIILLLTIIFVSACSSSKSPKYIENPYLIESAVAQPGEETRIELEDGAAIIIPANSIDENITVSIERNPEKIDSLPPFSEDVVPLGDFYNFTISEGELIGPVDLIFPFEPGNMPEEDRPGYLVIAIPTSEGDWEYIPAFYQDNKVFYQTMDVGDPIIAWHFTDDNDVEEYYQIMGPLCEPDLAVQIFPQEGDWDTTFTLIGRVEVRRHEFTSTLASSLVSFLLNEEIIREVGNIPIDILINPGGGPLHLIGGNLTDIDGTFEISISPNELKSLGFVDGENWVEVNAYCEDTYYDWFPNDKPNSGYVFFNILEEGKRDNISDIVIDNVDSSESEESNQEVNIEYSLPENSVQIPDVVGLPFHDAKEMLVSLGFNVSWIDGNSHLDLGMIYQQVPESGQYFVPERTTAIIFRTIKKDPLEPREFASGLPYIQYDCIEQVDISSSGCINTSRTFEQDEIRLLSDDMNWPTSLHYVPIWLPTGTQSVMIIEGTDYVDDTNCRHVLDPAYLTGSGNAYQANYKSIEECNYNFGLYLYNEWHYTINAEYDLKTGLLTRVENRTLYNSECKTSDPKHFCLYEPKETYMIWELSYPDLSSNNIGNLDGDSDLISIYEDIVIKLDDSQDSVHEIHGPIGSLTCSELEMYSWGEETIIFNEKHFRIINEPWIFGYYRTALYDDELYEVCPGLSN